MSSTSSLLTHFPLAFITLSSLRIWISLLDVYDVFRHSQVLSSPVTSYSQLQEGIYLFNHGIDPYAGGSFRHSPLLLSLFTTILPTSRRASSVLWTLTDILGAWMLVRIWRARQNVKSSWRDSLIATTYLFNPYLFLPSLALSTSTLENAVILGAVLSACRGRTAQSLFLLALSMHLSLNSVVILLPVVLLLIGDPHSHLASPQPTPATFKRIGAILAQFLFYATTLAAISTLVVNNFSWVPQTWGATLTLPDLQPNTGLWWYFFTEMFDHFRPFFLMVFSVSHLLIYVAPITIKFQYDPLFATFILLGILGTFKPYATLSDPGLFFSMISIFPELYTYLRHPIVTALLHLHAALLMPLFNHIWLAQGTGNANFFYATTLVFACANAAGLVDCIWAGMRLPIGQSGDKYEVVQE
ncbi:cell division cycle protein 91 [Panaeolus papilionaceus]|nr:cell division cycle protein 91 [Panaeolus papilionaceus]